MNFKHNKKERPKRPLHYLELRIFKTLQPTTPCRTEPANDLVRAYQRRTLYAARIIWFRFNQPQPQSFDLALSRIHKPYVKGRGYDTLISLKSVLLKLPSLKTLTDVENYLASGKSTSSADTTLLERVLGIPGIDLVMFSTGAISETNLDIVSVRPEPFEVSII